MRHLGNILKRATGVNKPRKSVSIVTSVAGSTNSSKVIYRFDNKMYSKEVDAIAIPVATSVSIKVLPGSQAMSN
jgi:hypothetical protein